MIADGYIPYHNAVRPKLDIVSNPRASQRFAVVAYGHTLADENTLPAFLRIEDDSPEMGYGKSIWHVETRTDLDSIFDSEMIQVAQPDTIQWHKPPDTPQIIADAVVENILETWNKEKLAGKCSTVCRIPGIGPQFPYQIYKGLFSTHLMQRRR